MTTTHPTLGENRLPRNPLLSEILEDAQRYEKERRRGRRKTKTK